MNLSVMTRAVTSKVARQILIGKKHSPVILFAGGIVGVVGSTVLACKATLQVEDVLDRFDEKMKQIEMVANEPKMKAQYSDRDAAKDRYYLRIQTAVKIGKLYAPAAALGVVSVAALTGSHVILTRRNVALTAAYKAVETAYDEYRQRVLNEVGEEREREIRYGVDKREIVEETEKGPKTKNLKVPKDGKGSKYARIFDEFSLNWSPEPFHNQFFLQTQQNWANDMLKSRGHIFLNEVYDMLGFERTKEGAVVGWVMGNGDDYVDFGIFDNDNWTSSRWVNGYERSILLDFNVDGLIYDKI